MATQPLLRFLDTNGDGTGTKEALGDYSSAAEEFYIECPAGETYEIARLIIYIEDGAGMDIGKYGNITALTNGIEFEANLGGEALSLDDGIPVKTNGDYKSLCYDQQIDGTGSGNDVCAVRWTFTKKGIPITLAAGDKLIVKLNDSFIGLVHHTFFTQGVRYYGG